MQGIWKNWDFINKQAFDRKLILFGRSDDWIEKNYRKLRGKIDCIVDNNPALHGSTYRDLVIYKPDEKLPADDAYVIITSGSYTGICEQLAGMGLKPGDDFCCTPYIADLAIIEQIQDHRAKVLVTIPDHHNKRKGDGQKGGIYLFELGKPLKKLLTGLYRQIARGDGCYYVIEHYEGLCLIDEEFNVVKKQDLEVNNQSHGVSCCTKRNLVFVANTGLDKITVHDGTSLEKVDELRFSDKYDLFDVEQHHLNDVCVHGDFLYFCYFSRSGNYRRGIVDGGVIQYKIDDLGAGGMEIARNLWYPHSVKVINGNICYLNTMRGELYLQSNVVAANFSGFMRGLSYDGKYYYIGQSINTYASRLRGISNHIMLNAGVYVFDAENHCSVFHPIPGVFDIHDVLAI